MSYEKKEKVRIPIEESRIPQSESEVLLSEAIGENGIWAKDEKSDFWNVVVKGVMDKAAPTFLNIIHAEVNKPENQGKSVSFTYKNHMFGQKFTNGFELIWRLKSNYTGGNKGDKLPPMPLAELFCGTWVEANMMLQKSTDNWYLADTQVVVNPNITDANDAAFAVAFVTLKRNRFTKPPVEEKKE